LPAIGDEPLLHPRLALRATQIEIGHDLAPSCMNHISPPIIAQLLAGLLANRIQDHRLPDRIARVTATCRD